MFNFFKNIFNVDFYDSILDKKDEINLVEKRCFEKSFSEDKLRSFIDLVVEINYPILPDNQFCRFLIIIQVIMQYIYINLGIKLVDDQTDIFKDTQT